MKGASINSVIKHALAILEKEVGLAKSSLAVVASRSFKPIADFFEAIDETNYREFLLNELDLRYQESLQDGSMSRNVFNLRTRGTRILREVFEAGTFSWKGPVVKKNQTLPESFELIITGVADSICTTQRNRNILSIVRSFLRSLANSGLYNIEQVTAEHVQSFLSEISYTRAKSMDDVISSLRKLDRYLINSGLSGLPYAGLLMAPRARERNIYPCMPQNELDLIIRNIDRGSAIGKRDFAILLLALSSGLRAGDIASIKLSDVNWRNREIQIVQGKTQNSINLPLHKNVGAALSDYILNGRPKSKSPQIFLRSLAPYQGFKDGVSVACVLRRRMKAADVSHVPGDGKTMHGIRRMLGTHMILEGVPVTTVAQVLGHQNIDATKPYISLDIEGLRQCALGFDSIEEGSI